jgi:hypothetical protein
MAPITISASARALAVRLRTTSPRRRSHAARSMFSEPADATDRAQHRREVERLGIDRDRRRHDRRADVVERAAQLARRKGELGRELETMARRQPAHDFGVDGVDDEQVHRSPFLSCRCRRACRMVRLPAF